MEKHPMPAYREILNYNFWKKSFGMYFNAFLFSRRIVDLFQINMESIILGDGTIEIEII